eukprot:3343116-Prymnesium_polylepis.1
MSCEHEQHRGHEQHRHRSCGAAALGPLFTGPSFHGWHRGTAVLASRVARHGGCSSLETRACAGGGRRPTVRRESLPMSLIWHAWPP